MSRRSSLLFRFNIKSCLIVCVVKCTNSENCMKLYLRIVNFDEWNNIGIHDFSIWDHLGFGQRVCL